MHLAIKAAGKGLYGGDPEKVLKARADLVLTSLDYAKFLNDYEIADYELNKKE